jgi:hypothetical protein
MAGQAVSTTVTAVEVIKAVASRAHSAAIVHRLVIAHKHAVDSASVQVVDLVSAQAAVTVQALANALVVASVIAAHRVAVRLATVLIAPRVTTALPIAKPHKMHVTIHAVFLHRPPTAL